MSSAQVGAAVRLVQPTTAPTPRAARPATRVAYAMGCVCIVSGMTHHFDAGVLAAAARHQETSNAQYERRRAANASEENTEQLAALVEAMKMNLSIAEQAQGNAQRAERHSRIISYASLALAVASLAAAIVAIFVSL